MADPASFVDPILRNPDWQGNEWGSDLPAPTLIEALTQQPAANPLTGEYWPPLGAPGTTVPNVPIGFGSQSIFFNNTPIPGVDTDAFFANYQALASGLMSEYGADTPSGGAGSAAAAAYEQAQRNLWREFQQKELDLELQDIIGTYQPNLNKMEADIARHRAGQQNDAGIYTGIMRMVPNVYARTGQATDENYAKARQALATQNAAARGQIDASFASARGRVRALVLSTSQYSPEAAETIGQGIDEISAYISRGMASDQAGWDRVLQASHRLAEATLQAASTATVGEAARTGRQTLRQYQNAIDDMLLEKRRLVEARDHALEQARNEAALALQKQESQWALQDAQRAAAGGSGSSAAADRLRQFFVDNPDIFSLDGYITNTMSYYAGGAGIDPLDRDAVTDILTVLATNNMSASVYGGMIRNQLHEEGLSLEDEMELRRTLALIDNPDYEGMWEEGSAIAQAAPGDWEQMIHDPQNPFALSGAAYQYGLDFGWDEGDLAQFIINEEDPFATARQLGVIAPTAGARPPTPNPVNLQRLMSGINYG